MYSKEGGGIAAIKAKPRKQKPTNWITKMTDRGRHSHFKRNKVKHFRRPFWFQLSFVESDRSEYICAIIKMDGWCEWIIVTSVLRFGGDSVATFIIHARDLVACLSLIGALEVTRQFPFVYFNRHADIFNPQGSPRIPHRRRSIVHSMPLLRYNDVDADNWLMMNQSRCEWRWYPVMKNWQRSVRCVPGNLKDRQRPTDNQKSAVKTRRRWLTINDRVNEEGNLLLLSSTIYHERWHPKRTWQKRPSFPIQFETG